MLIVRRRLDRSRARAQLGEELLQFFHRGFSFEQGPAVEATAGRAGFGRAAMWRAPRGEGIFVARAKKSHHASLPAILLGVYGSVLVLRAAQRARAEVPICSAAASEPPAGTEPQ